VPLANRTRERIAELPPRIVTGVWHRQTDPERQPLQLPPIAIRDGRWHAAGHPWPAYASSAPDAAMLELVRGIDRSTTDAPPLPTRRMSQLFVADLPVIAGE